MNLDNFKNSLIKEQHSQIKIVSDSMLPLIKPGEILSVIPLSAPLKRFDIILFNNYGNPFCHFYWGSTFDPNYICTKSLKAPGMTDPSINVNSVIGIIEGKRINFVLKLKVYLRILCYKK